MIEEPGDRRLASYIIDQIGDLGIDVAVYRIGLDAEGGWELVAHYEDQWWRIATDHVLNGAVDLAQRVDIDLEG